MAVIESMVGFPESAIPMPEGALDIFVEIRESGDVGVTLFGGGSELRIADGTSRLKEAWDAWLDLAFPEPWRTPEQKSAQSQAISSTLYRLFLVGRNAGRVVTFYPVKP